MTEFVPLTKLVSALKAATEEGKSGAFFITTEQQHSAMVTLKSGEITGVKFRNTRGYDAASSISEIEQVKYQSAAEPTELPGEVPLNTGAVLEILTTGDSGSIPTGGGTGSAPAIDLDKARRRYISAIGPIGGALFDEAVEEMGEQLGTQKGVQELVDRLAAQIDDEAEATDFRGDIGS